MDAQLRGLLLQTTNPNVDLIRVAEQGLRSMESSNPDFAKALLTIVQSNDMAAMPAAILFKNYIGRNWKPDSEVRLCNIDEASREYIKNMLIGLMCSSPPATQRQLSEAVRFKTRKSHLKKKLTWTLSKRFASWRRMTGQKSGSRLFPCL